jgi:hypothetical protein
MPFKKVGSNDYTSPSGRHFNSAQVRLYYAGGGHFPGEKHEKGGPVAYAKGSAPQAAHYAEGGPVLGRTRDFIKEPDGADQRAGGFQVYKNPTAKEDQDYGKNVGGHKDPPPTTLTKALPIKGLKPRK